MRSFRVASSGYSQSFSMVIICISRQASFSDPSKVEATPNGRDLLREGADEKGVISFVWTDERQEVFRNWKRRLCLSDIDSSISSGGFRRYTVMHRKKVWVVFDATWKSIWMLSYVYRFLVANWASMRIESNLMLQIKEAQRDDGELWAIVQNVEDGMWFPNDQALRRKIITYLIVFSKYYHPVSTQKYRDLKHTFVDGMKQDVATFVSKCMTCQQVKIEHQRASGLLQPLEIPVWKWDEISMDFVTGLPTTQKRHDAIWVVVDRLTKSAHFLPIRKNYGISKLAEIFRQEIVRLHGTPTSIVSDRDLKFTSRFWKGLQKAWGTRLKFSTTFHPQTDGQSERTIQTYEDDVEACALEDSFKLEILVFLEVSPFRGVKRFGIKGKLSPRFIGPFEILERIGEIQPDMSLSEEPESILDRQERVMRNKVIPFVKILWKNHPEREAT
ncbi:retrotransposon protein, putative, ty3-gypsy subclass [Tanacetum coccineum]